MNKIFHCARDSVARHQYPNIVTKDLLLSPRGASFRTTVFDISGQKGNKCERSVFVIHGGTVETAIVCFPTYLSPGEYNFHLKSDGGEVISVLHDGVALPSTAFARRSRADTIQVTASSLKKRGQALHSLLLELVE